MLGWRRGRRGRLKGRRWLVRELIGMPFKLCISTSRHSDGTGILRMLVSGSARQSLAEGGTFGIAVRYLPLRGSRNTDTYTRSFYPGLT